jgi:acylphosphatase
VQGVGFRYAAAARARSLDVSGWIRNELDGSVVAVFEGDSERVRSMVDWCGRGPSGARVDDVEVVDEQPAGELSFNVH